MISTAVLPPSPQLLIGNPARTPLRSLFINRSCFRQAVRALLPETVAVSSQSLFVEEVLRSQGELQEPGRLFGVALFGHLFAVEWQSGSHNT